MFKIEALVATTNETERTLTDDNLHQLAESAVGTPVFNNFDQRKKIGEITDAKVSDGGLFISAEIDAWHEGRYIAPSILFCGNLETVQSLSFSLVRVPMDESLPPIGGES